MKAYTKWFLPCLFIVIGFSGASCEDEKDELQTQLDNLIFEMVVLDDDSNEGTVFPFGTDVALALKVTNDSGEDFLWDVDNDCILLDLDDFFTIHMYKEGNQDVNGETVNLGKPYAPLGGCLGVNFPPRKITPGITIFFEEPWSQNHTIPLSAGRYFSEFSHNLRIDNDHSISLNLRVEFQIE